MTYPPKNSSKVRVAAAQFGAGQDVDQNLATCLKAIDQAAECQPDFLVLPEFSNHCSWYDNKEHCYKVSVPVGGPFLNAVAEKAKQYGMYIVINVTLQRPNEIATGTSLLFDPNGNLVGEKDKEVLMGHENDFLERAKKPGPIIETPLGKVGMYSCMDGVIMETTRSLALRGGQILLNSLNSFAWDEGSLHIPVRAAENKCFIVAANKVGSLIPEFLLEPVSQATSIPIDNLHGSGESQIVAPDGTVLAMAPRKGDTFIWADIDPKEADNKLRPDGTDVFTSRRPELYESINKETPIVDPPTLADFIKTAVYQPKSDGVAAIQEVVEVLKTKDINTFEVIVLPELFCFENASVKDLSEAVTRSAEAVKSIQGALSGSPSIVATSIVESHANGYQHVGVAITKDGIVFRQPQIHRAERHAWSVLGDSFKVFNQPWGNFGIVVADDSIYPETFRLLTFQNVQYVALPAHIQEKWELTTGVLERSAENRIAIAISSRKTIQDDESCCRIFNPFVDFTLMTPWPNRPFDGLISQPRIDSQLKDGLMIEKELNIKGSQNKVISSKTHLVYSRPIGNLEALVTKTPSKTVS